jgi:NADPH-dependent curcumin reductase CurA
MISQYNDTSPTDNPVNVFLGITKAQLFRDHYESVCKWIKERNSIDGLETSSNAFISLFNGENFGKTLVNFL